MLVEKLLSDFNFDMNIIGWILDFMIERSQCVRVNGVLSGRFENRHIIKFADDTVIVSLLKGGDMDHGLVGCQ